MTNRRTNIVAAVAGIVAAAATLALAEAIAVIVAPASGPLFAVGSWIIDVVPSWLKNLVIALFGTGDKVALLVSLWVLVILLAGLIGILEFRRPPSGIVGLAVVGGVAVIAVLTRAEATATWALPTIVGLVGGALVLRSAVRRLHAWQDAAALPSLPPAGVEAPANTVAVGRRGFLTMIIGTAAAAALVGVGARAINAGATAVMAARRAIRLPRPAVAAPPIPAGAALAVPGIAPLVTRNQDFYRIDTALQVPAVDAAGWRLRVTGMVENEIEIGFDELLALPMRETYVTLMCVSNEVGGSLVGNAKWLGHPIRELLARARPLAGADVVLSTSVDGWTATTPLEVLQDPDRDSILAVGMNGAPLPLEHGFPVRMVVPGLYGYVSATKWVVQLKVSTFAKESSYWTDRGWSPMGPVKTSSRIDVPAAGAEVRAGTVAVAGVAWAQHTGIDAVEVRVDGGTWNEASLAEAISADTWRQWLFSWEAEKGMHTLEVRARDSAGGVQSGTPVPVVPNGAEGYHAISVRVN